MNGFEGTVQLMRLALRRDRLRIPVWVLAIAGITAVSGAAVEGLYPDQAQIDAYANLVASSPMTVAFAGPPIGLNTVAGIIVYETSFTAIVGIALMAITMTSRHTRAEEESGRSELVRATQVGRYAGGAAALLTVTLACTALAVATGLSLAPTPMGVRAAAVFAAGIGVLGVVYAAITLCLGQLFEHARTATGATLVVFALGYVLRAAGDVREDWLVWLSPVGWVQATHVPVENRWWPLLLPLVAAVAFAALAVVLVERRDFGGGMLPTRPARSSAPPSLSGVMGLTWRMQRGTVLGWSATVLFFGLITGALGTSMEDMVQENPALADYIEMTQGASMVDSYIATMVLILALVAGGFAVWSAGRPGADEDEGQLELVLSGPLSRVRAMSAHLLVTVVGTALVLLAAAVGVGTAHGYVTGEVSEGWRAAIAQLAYLPAVLVLAGTVALFVGWLPRWSWAGWVLLSFAFVAGWLGGLLELPESVLDFSPFTYVPRVPIESVADAALPLLTLVALGLMALGAVGFRRRDIATS